MRPRPQPPAVPAPFERWVGLREAEELTGIPSSTIRNWARKQRIESRFELDESGDRRYVEVNEVVAWADHLGRQHKRVASAADAASRESPVAKDVNAAAPEAALAKDVEVAGPEARVAGGPVSETRHGELETRDQTARTRDEELAARDPEPDAPPPQTEPDIPEGTMLVPLDAWNKMLMQLGNLHQAGQQLAEARERAARAETEVRFLRERLAEMRDQARQDSDIPVSPPAEETQPDPGSGEEDPLWVDLYRRWKRRRR